MAVLMGVMAVGVRACPLEEKRICRTMPRLRRVQNSLLKRCAAKELK